MPKKAYIASSFKLADKVREVEHLLEKAGYTVICKWWTGLDYIPGEGRTLNQKSDLVSNAEFYSSPGCETAFKRDFSAVKECDFFVLVAGDVPRPFNGANIELGIAIGADKFCFSVGVLDNSALYYPVIKCKDNIELLSQIKKWTSNSMKLPCGCVMRKEGEQFTIIPCSLGCENYKLALEKSRERGNRIIYT